MAINGMIIGIVRVKPAFTAFSHKKPQTGKPRGILSIMLRLDNIRVTFVDARVNGRKIISIGKALRAAVTGPRHNTRGAHRAGLT